MSGHLQRALMLLEQSRYELAEEELRQVLGQDPDNAMAHAVLAICLSNREKFKAATEEAELAIHLAPDVPFMYYAQSIVLVGRNQFAEARVAIQNAIGMDPYQEQFFGQLAQIEFQLKQWQAALEAAEAGLDLDPEDVTCTNLRAMALVKLGKNIEAQGALDTALKRAPEDAVSHANMGWSLLEQNQPQKAMEHFREALRLNPEMEWARAGIVEAMKARYFIYRVMLNWFLWMAKLQQNAQWGVIIGAYVGYRVLRSVAKANPNLAPFIQPVLIIYVAFALMTWLASPLFNLVLRTSKFGRLALSDEQIRTSTWVGLCVLGTVAMLTLYFVQGSFEYLMGAIACGLLIPAISQIYNCSPGWPRSLLALISIALGFVAAVIIACLVGSVLVSGQPGRVLEAIAVRLVLPFVYSAVATQFGVNYLVTVRPIRGANSGKLLWRAGLAVLAVAGLLLTGFIGLVLIGANHQDPQFFTYPIRTSFEPADSLTWYDPERLAADTSALEEAGFTLLDDFTMDGLEDARLRVLQSEDRNAWVEISENLDGYVVSFASAYDDGREFTTNDLMENPFTQRPEHTEMFFDLPVAEHYEAFLAARPNDGLRQFTPDGLMQFLREIYVKDTDFTLARGGPTVEEFKKIALNAGVEEFTDERAEHIRSIWRRQATSKVNEFVVKQLRSNGELSTSYEDDAVFCVHGLLSAGAAAELLFDRRLQRKNRYGGELIDRIGNLGTGQLREEFAELANEIDGLSKLTTVNEPIDVDVYVIDSN